ncbi:hypothetical protein [Paraburkholderia sp. A3RO-2L]|jgi:hypothetical protein|uniref:hypothetical protein n=1 Tax=unclassified Paraburkholderia TaxID=2615204 RepID=UPI003DA85F3F
MYALAHQFLLWTTGPGTYLFVTLMLVGAFSGTAVGDPIPVLEGCALGLLSGLFPAHAIAFSQPWQIAVAVGLLFWTATFIGMQLRCLFAPPGFHFRAWSPIQILQRG